VTIRMDDQAAERRPETPVIRVFLLDDHELVRRGLRDILMEAHSFEVVGECASAQEAIRLIPALRPDVALLDVQLPDGSGIDVCRQVRAVDPGIRVLMVSTFDDQEGLLAAAMAGASGYVVKQIRSGDLADSVRGVAAGECLLDGAAVARVLRPSPTGVGDPALATLTGQERRVLDLIVDGLTNRQIGRELGLSEKTVKNYVTGVLAKLGLESRTQAAVFAARNQPG
jgi:two-component system response regulator DevR